MAMRKYRAMAPDKLTRCMQELERKEGDAWERIVVREEDYEAHLNACESACAAKGVVVGVAGAPDGKAPASRAKEPMPTTLRYIAPQLAFDVQGDFLRIPTEGWVMEPKFDGWRWQVHVTKSGVYSIGGRNGKRHDGEAPLVDGWLSENLPHCILDGEVLWEANEPSRRQAQFIAFDVLDVEGEDVCDLPWKERRVILEDLMPPLDGPFVRLSPVSNVDADLFDAWIDFGMEGCVAKRKSAPYLPGSRRRDGFVKVKPQATTDAIVVGLEMGKGAGNSDRVGALTVRLVETGVETSCAFDSEVEKAYPLKGRRIELAHYGFTEAGKVRHPVFRRLREDLEPVV